MLPFAKMKKSRRVIFVTLAIIGSAMLIGDGIITPAVSVLSAIEGLSLGISGIGTYAPYISAGVSNIEVISGISFTISRYYLCFFVVKSMVRRK
jgi:K+ transporter